MRGFELKFKGQTLSLPSEAVITITRSKRDEVEKIHIHAGAYDPPSQNSITWFKSELTLGDELFVTIKEIEQAAEPVEVFNFFERMNKTKEESDKKALERFRTLEEELKRENLI